MQFTFLDMANQVLFIRDDAERAEWTVEELSLDLDFPIVPDKRIATGQRVMFTDPYGGTQIYEVKIPKTAYDGMQSVHAEHICISELNDEHIADDKEIKNHSCSVALKDVLDGTLWSLGHVNANPKSSASISRGSVWQAVLAISTNWNVYIVPRVTISATGEITRKLDIEPTEGVYEGVRLSINKNMLDPCVTYDDSEVYTAMFGYGGTSEATKDKDGEEITFNDVTWKKTDDHPAKPKDQKWIEDTTATKRYGRNGRKRWGYYVNTSIKDPEILLEKTWEMLKTKSHPQISVDGTVADLYRLGYADQPIKLHGIAIVDIEPYGFSEQLQIIRLTVDLLDPSRTTPTIGAYIPNIVYLAVNTDNAATGGRGGGGRNSPESPKAEFEAHVNAINEGTAIQITAFQRDLTKLDADVKLQEANLTVEHNRISAEVTDRRQADKELKGAIDVTSESVKQIVTSVGKDGVVTAASIVTAINGGTGSVVISADRIDIEGIVTSLGAYDIGCGSLTVEGRAEFYKTVEIGQGIECDANAKISVSDGKLRVGGYDASWKSKVITTYNLSETHAFMYRSGDTTPTILGKLVTSTAESTIYYLGR